MDETCTTYANFRANDTFKSDILLCVCRRLAMKMNYSVLWIAYLSDGYACDGINRLKHWQNEKNKKKNTAFCSPFHREIMASHADVDN